MESQIEEVKNKLDIIEVIGSYIKLTKTGANYRGACPFHSEKTPSFFVSPSRQMFKCFGCGAGHSVFDFVMKIEGIEFGDALRLLAKRAGVELKRENPKLQTERQRLYEICELSCSFFEKQLEMSFAGKEAKDYLLKRGIKEESIKKWRLGYSPDTWQGLSDFLIGQGYNRKEIISAGLAVKKENSDNDSYDRFRGRIIFPVFDLNSNPVGFGARIFKTKDKQEGAKYINTPQTLLYDKSSTIYGMNFAKLPVRKQNQVVVTEGYTDVIMCHQAGFENTIASSGTALTLQHLNILKRYSDNLLLAFDMDVAGDSATKRGIDLAQEKGFNIKIIDTYSGAKDPADIILEDSLKWKESLQEARTIMDYYFDSAFSRNDKNKPEGKKEIAKIILPMIKRMPNNIEQAFWVQKLSQKLDIKEEAIFQELKKAIGASKNFQDNPGIWQKKEEPEGRKKMLEDKILGLLFKNPENINLIEPCHMVLFCQKTKTFLENFKNNSGSSAIFSDTNPELANLSMKAEAEFAEDGKEELVTCLFQLKNIELRNELSLMSKLIEKEQDLAKKEELVKQFDKKAKELHIVKS